MSTNQSKSILDQVDEYLHEHDDSPTGSADLGHRKDAMEVMKFDHEEHAQEPQREHDWMQDAIRIDLDQLSDSLFSVEHINQLGTENTSGSQSQGNSLKVGENGKYMARGSFFHGHRDIIGNLHSMTAPSEIMFSPSDSPMVAPNHSSALGLQVTPFMDPQNMTIGNSNSNTPFMAGNDSSNTDSPMIGAGSGHVGSFSLPDSAVVPLSRTSTSNSPGTGLSKKASSNSLKKKKSSISGQSGGSSTTIPNAKIIKSSPYMNATRSRRRYSKSKTVIDPTTWEDATAFNLPESGINLGGGNTSIKMEGTPATEFSENSSSSSIGFPTVVLPSTTPIGGDEHGKRGLKKVPLDNDGVAERDTVGGGNGSDSTIDARVSRRSRVLNATESPILMARKTSYTSRSRSKSNSRGKDEFKKEIHKAAEQGRRNRLNNALIQLGNLLPEEMKSTVSIPSKATTAELACLYIQQLQEQVEDLRNR
ncbi:phosphate-sensing transcription factor PHO4 KNAG_0L01210 [Huiozyma naganishii CBS 8797]|uniref:BHLH domain-containing protein n=1 Tax=Huiozyma naganishii (strain ATCC MYA-139 / BCRC 22969 / CBS 8797 / KCTC 17520 / NBRC 10181 / NCYC 3082 / Yp74L-3) TaxID=1071383 RepID=J7SB48_HUIN7|nr:hypothetical protein KNAG_0L01210 [Kazachstania naganishii CBS 8797]CCK72741.1 hypothetical protein KNAG_0L01210 [Kazachstania naganishii CBS 8797]